MKNRCFREKNKGKGEEEIIKEMIKDHFSERKDMHFHTERVY